MLDDEALYFAHLPKNSGNTARDAFGRWFDAAEVFPSFREFDPAGLPAGTLPRYRYIGSHFQRSAFDRVAASRPRRWWKVVFLREPAERLESHLRYAARVPENGLHARVAGRELAALLRDPGLHDELADYQSRYLVQALSPRDRPVEEASAVLAEDVDVLGLSGCVESSLLLIAHRLRQFPVRPYDPALFGNVDPGLPPPGQGRRPLDASRRAALAAWNRLDRRLYEAGVARFGADFATLCETLGVAPIDPFSATLADLAPLRAAVQAAAVSALRASPQPVGEARILRFLQGRPLQLCGDRDGSLLLRRFWAHAQPILVQFYRGESRLGELDLLLHLPAGEPPPTVALEGRELRLREVGPEGGLIRYRADAAGAELRGRRVCELRLVAGPGQRREPGVGLAALRLGLRD
jgi:hypothetical protein